MDSWPATCPTLDVTTQMFKQTQELYTKAIHYCREGRVQRRPSGARELEVCVSELFQWRTMDLKGHEARRLLMDSEKDLGPVGLGSWIWGQGIIVGNLEEVSWEDRRWWPKSEMLGVGRLCSFGDGKGVGSWGLKAFLAMRSRGSWKSYPEWWRAQKQ